MPEGLPSRLTGFPGVRFFLEGFETKSKMSSSGVTMGSTGEFTPEEEKERGLLHAIEFGKKEVKKYRNLWDGARRNLKAAEHELKRFKETPEEGEARMKKFLVGARLTKEQEEAWRRI